MVRRVWMLRLQLESRAKSIHGLLEDILADLGVVRV